MHLQRRLKVAIATFAFGCAAALNATHAADIFWSITAGTSDTEIITEGDQVFGYYFNPDVNRPATVTVNTVPFTHRTTTDAPPGLNFNGSYNNAENVDLYQVPL